MENKNGGKKNLDMKAFLCSPIGRAGMIVAMYALKCRQK